MSGQEPLHEPAAQRLREAHACRERGELDAARARCEEVLRLVPENAAALGLLAELAVDAGDESACLRLAERARAADPQAAGPHFTLGRLHQSHGRLAEAERCYGEALRRAPRHARAHNNLGAVLHMQGRLGEALACYRKAIEIDPAQPEANQNYASIARDAGAFAQAIEGYRRQIAANPADAHAHNNLANALRELGHHAEALAHFDRAVALDPDFVEAHFSRAFVLLLLGEYAEGWREYEWRWRLPAYEAPARRFSQPMWDGQPFRGTLLLHADQGLGDTAQFARYALLAAERCDAVVLECQRPLVPLMKSVRGLREVVAQGQALPAFDRHLPLMSLPFAFGTTLDTVPWQGPYLHADRQRVAYWRTRLAERGKGLNVGLAWAGRPDQWDDRKRSLTLAALAPLARVHGVRFYSLQHGEAAAQAALPPAGMALISPGFDYSDAGLMQALDVVVTIDTSTAHVAGAMGVRTWVLVAYAPDWRYHVGRNDNAWYPTMRLFRQRRDGDWSEPIEQVAQALAREAGSAR